MRALLHPVGEPGRVDLDTAREIKCRRLRMEDNSLRSEWYLCLPFLASHILRVSLREMSIGTCTFLLTSLSTG